MAVDSLDTIDQNMLALLKGISDRLYPLHAQYLAQVTPYSFVKGILFELWAVIQ